MIQIMKMKNFKNLWLIKEDILSLLISDLDNLKKEKNIMIYSKKIKMKLISLYNILKKNFSILNNNILIYYK